MNRSASRLALALVPWLAWAGLGSAQMPAPPASPTPAAPARKPPVFTKNPAFRLPVRLDDRVRANIREIQFYFRQAGGEWTLRESAPADRNTFEFRAPQDGEYWFQFVLVDRDGRSTPAQLPRDSASIMVIVDSTAPEIDVHPLPISTGQVYLQCNLRDANPDYSSIHLECLQPDQTWKPLAAVPNAPGVFAVSDERALAGRVRATGSDRAGNVTTREIDLAQGSVSRPTEPAKLPEAVTAPEPTTPAAVVPVAAAAAATAPATNLLLNTTHCKLDYAPPPAGQAGKAEVWLTADQGKTWTLGREFPKAEGMAEFDLPGEGVFGVVVVVLAPGLKGGEPPAAGEVPDVSVEIDTAAPSVTVEPGQLVEAATGRSVRIGWKATNKNLGPTPVKISFAVDAAGPWQPVAADVPNSGTFNWPVPANVGSQVIFRIEVADRAGNIGRADSAAVLLVPARTRARILGLTPAAKPE